MEPQLRGASGIFSPKLRPHSSGFQNTTSDLNKFRSTEQNIPLSCDQRCYFNIDPNNCLQIFPSLADKWEDIGMTIRSATVDPIHRITKDSFRTTFNQNNTCASLFWSTGMKAKLRKDLFCQTFPKRMFHPPSQLGHQEETELEKFVRLLFTLTSIWGTTFPSKAQSSYPGHNYL